MTRPDFYQFTSIEVALSVGGLDLRLQEAALRKNPDIVIATPGRLIDHIKNTPTFGLENIEFILVSGTIGVDVLFFAMRSRSSEKMQVLPNNPWS